MNHSFQHPFGDRAGFPPPPQSAPNDGHGLAVASLVLGILSLLLSCCCGILLLPPLLFSLLSIAFAIASRKLSRRFYKKAIASLILSTLALLLLVLLFAVIIWLSSLSEAELRALFGKEFYVEISAFAR